MDPKRLLSSDATAFERSLLDAVSQERPSPALQEGMRRALGLPEAATTALAAKTSILSWGKATLLATFTAGGLAVGTLTLKHEETHPLILAPQKAESRAVPVPEAAATADPLPEVEKRPARPAASNGSSELREEIRMLDQARSALRSGSPRRALSLLSSYGERFPRGVFRQEANVVRMEALNGSGEHARAAALATKFLADYPKSPHVERVKRIAR